LEPTDDHDGHCKLELLCSYQGEVRMAEAVIRLTGDANGTKYEHQIAGTQINLDTPDASKEVQWAKRNLAQAAKRYLEIRARNPRPS
jgi:hypothetical protein